MGLADLWRPSQDWETFWFNNWISHQNIVQAIGTQKSRALTMYPIHRWTKDDMENLLALHQQYHDDMNEVLGIPGTDLTTVDLEDPASVATWAFNNFSEHQSAHALLKL